MTHWTLPCTSQLICSLSPFWATPIEIYDSIYIYLTTKLEKKKNSRGDYFFELFFSNWHGKKRYESIRERKMKCRNDQCIASFTKNMWIYFLVFLVFPGQKKSMVLRLYQWIMCGRFVPLLVLMSKYIMHDDLLFFKD